MLCLRRQLVGEMRFAHSLLKPALSDQSVAFERDQMRAHRVVCQTEVVRQIVNSTPRPAEQTHYLPTRAVKKTLVQPCRFHITRSPTVPDYNSSLAEN